MRSGVLAEPRGLVGRTCVIRTDRLRRDFGLAEVTAADGRSVFIEVRLFGEADAANGWSALIYDYNPAARFYWVVPVDAAG
jgi:hypothetical protein